MHKIQLQLYVLRLQQWWQGGMHETTIFSSASTSNAQSTGFPPRGVTTPKAQPTGFPPRGVTTRAIETGHGPAVGWWLPTISGISGLSTQSALSTQSVLCQWPADAEEDHSVQRTWWCSAGEESCKGNLTATHSIGGSCC